MVTARALALILLITCATAAPAEARSWHRWDRAWWGQQGRTYGVWALACDRVSRRCTPAIRYFSNPVWR